MDFSKWLMLESVNVTISDYDGTDNIHNLEDLAYQLSERLIKPIMLKLQPEDRLLAQPYYNIIVPDGNYYINKNDATLNFYFHGLEKVKDKILQGIKYFLDELGMKYGEFKEEKSKMFEGNVIRIPILHLNKTKNAPPSLNLSNDNADLIFGKLLKFHKNNHSYEIPAVDLYRRIEELESQEIASTEKLPFKIKNHIDFGLSQSQIEERLEKIKEIAKFAIKNNYDLINIS